MAILLTSADRAAVKKTMALYLSPPERGGAVAYPVINLLPFSTVLLPPLSLQMTKGRIRR